MAGFGLAVMVWGNAAEATPMVAAAPTEPVAGPEELAPAAPSPNYLVGRGMTDITGPAYGIPLWGFGRPDQLTHGIHTRQKARAFIIADPQTGDRLAFISIDVGSIDHNTSLEVVDRLKARYGDLYRLDNVIISATHTHATPGGLWHTRAVMGLAGSFYPEFFDHVVSGIVGAVEAAHVDLKPGTIRINEGEIEGTGANRSMTAYEQNPAAERARYAHPIDREMTLLRFEDEAGPVGLLNWHAVHPTSMTYDNHLISGDHKGYASLAFERAMGVRYNSRDDFVAAFAQSTPGDVTPNLNLDNTGPGADMFESTAIIGARQLAGAQELFETAETPLVGPIATRQVYIDLSDFEVAAAYADGETRTTCPSAYGYAFAGGSTEDGGGHFLFSEGMMEQSVILDFLIRFLTGAPEWTEDVHACQQPKAILFETGTGTPPLQSQIRSLSLARIGQLVIVAVPAEVTTMAARRLKETVRAELGDWAEYIVIAGYSNGYAGYVTTPEEYAVQHYEGGHTLHGPWTLPAYRQTVAQLATALAANRPVTGSPAYDDWRGKSEEEPLHDGSADRLVEGAAFGDALPLARHVYSAGDMVHAEFRSGNPTARLAAPGSYVYVERQTGEGWVTVADDADWETQIAWQDRGAEGLVATVSWKVPSSAVRASYRIRHEGVFTDAEGQTQELSAVSDLFVVELPVE